MKNFIKIIATAALVTGAAMFASAPARADGVSISIGVPGVGFSYSSGGYCDEWGCPENYWDMPVYYGPVFYGGSWYRGPIYYRRINGEYWYWIHGGWHRDHWRGPRPAWYRHGHYRYGRALGYDYYRGHGFRHDHDRYWRRHERREIRHEHREYRRDVRHERRVMRRAQRAHRQEVRHERRVTRRAQRAHRQEVRHDRREHRREERQDHNNH